MPQQMIFDMREGEVFIHEGKTLKAALYAKIQNVLKQRLLGYMTEVQGELDGQTPQVISDLLLGLKLTRDLDAKTILVKECLRRAEEVQREIEFLEYVQANLRDDIVYKLNLDQVIRYGIKPGKSSL